MRDAIYKAVMTNGTRQTFNQMKTLYRNAELAEEKNRILLAMGYRLFFVRSTYFVANNPTYDDWFYEDLK